MSLHSNDSPSSDKHPDWTELQRALKGARGLSAEAGRNKSKDARTPRPGEEARWRLAYGFEDVDDHAIARAVASVDRALQP
jgi:hypothetical protein